MAKSFVAEVIADGTDKFFKNSLRFYTREQAESYVQDLACRWAMVTDTRVSESDDEPNSGDPAPLQEVDEA